MDGFVRGYFLIKLVRVFDRAVFYAGGTAPAFVLFNISWFFNQAYSEVPRFTLYPVNFSIG
jgi:hypothetical protein